MRIRGSTLAATVMAVVTALTASCTASIQSSPSPTASATDAPAVSPSPTADPANDPSVQRTVAVGNLDVALVCWGDGSPTVVLEIGSTNIEEWTGSALVHQLVGTRVCTYDRPGTGQSEDPPNERRDADDAIAVLKQVLSAGQVGGPYVLLGRSFGGMIVTHYAAELPEDVLGVVVVDTPAPSAEWSEQDQAELAWDNPGNSERLDVLNGFEIRFASDPPALDLPLLLISPIDGESSAEDQAFWLTTTDSQAEQVIPSSCDDPMDDECATKIREFVQGLSSGG